MLPIFDPRGSVTAWLRDNIIHGLDGAPKAFIQGENIINYTGIHCGFLKNGFFRDHKGNITAFMKGAADGPMTPPARIPPVAPIPGVAPIKPAAPIPPAAAMPTFLWSKLSWDAFIAAIKQPAPPKPPDNGAL